MKGMLYYNIKYSLILRKPLLIKRLVQNTVKSKIFRKAVMRYTDVCVSTKCNLKCTHCFATSFDSSSHEVLSINKWKNVAKQCMELGSTSFGITGGEPLLFQQLPELIENLYPNENLITINSNGTLLTDKNARELYDAGVDVFQFSMDSFNPEEHDLFRKKAGVFSALMRSIDIAQNNNLKVTLVCTVGHSNIKSRGVLEVIEFARKRGFLVILSRATPAGEWLGNKDILLTKEDQAYMYGLVGKYAHARTDMDTNFMKYGCSAATEKLYVTHKGDIIPCPFMHISFGNVWKDSVQTIRNRMLTVPRLNSYSNTCHVAEDIDFIENTLEKTFESKSLEKWDNCF